MRADRLSIDYYLERGGYICRNKNVLVSMLIVLTAVIIPTISYAAATTTPRDDMDNDNGNSLRDLIFLEGLSSGNNFSDLFVLDRLSGGDSDLGTCSS